MYIDKRVTGRKKKQVKTFVFLLQVITYIKDLLPNYIAKRVDFED